MIAAALMGFVTVPASATTITHARASTFAPADTDPFLVGPISTGIDVTVADDVDQPKRTSFAAVADELYDIVAPLTFGVNSADGATVVNDATATISFATDRGTIVLRRRAAGTFNADVSGASILPEAATWAMMLIGFALVGFGMRYGIRRSNARFDLKVQRIAAGLET